MQRPTCTNTRIRSSADAHQIFYATKRGILPMVTRRLDMEERAELRTGCIYVWEERSPHTEVTGLGIERFTEGRRWSPSRVRDEFLFYYEKWAPPLDTGDLNQPEIPNGPPNNWEPLVKQTYSVYVETENGSRKWHLTAYFTQASVDQLSTVDDLEGVGGVEVPKGMFQSTRLTKRKAEDPLKSMTPTVQHAYAPLHPNRRNSQTTATPYAQDNSAYFYSNPVLNQPLHQPPPATGGYYATPRSHPSAIRVPSQLDAYPPGPHYSPPSSDSGHYPHQYDYSSHPPPQRYPTHTYGYPPPSNNLENSIRPVSGPSRSRRGTLESYRILPPPTLPEPREPAVQLRIPSPSWERCCPPIILPNRSPPPALFNTRSNSPFEAGSLPALPEPGGMVGGNSDAKLVPLRNLLRSHPYRRDPVDDRVLRKLDPTISPS